MKTRLRNILVFGSALIITSTFFAQVSGSGRAYDFNSNFIDIPNSTSLNMTNITLEAWIKADSWATNIWENVIISKDGWATGDEGYTIRCGANGSLSFLIGDAVPGWHEVASGPLMSTGQWYHVAGTYDGQVMRLFLNGEEVATTNYTGTISSTSYNLTIGKMSYVPGGGRYFDGMIDEVRIWNSALPQSALRNFMCKKVTAVHPNYSNLVGYWNFDVSGPVLDQSPQGNNGTVMGPTLLNSSAPLGNESIHQYGTSANLTLTNAAIDSLKVTSTSVFKTIHIYRVDGPPLVTAAPSSLDSLDQNHYYGVYATSIGAYSYNLEYHYGSNPLLTGTQAYGRVATRLNGSAVPWLPSAAVHDIANSKFTVSLSTRIEARLAYDCPGISLSPSASQTICDGDSVVLIDNGLATVHQWYNASGPISGQTGSSLTVQTTGSYYVIANDGSCTKTSANIAVNVHPNPVANFGTLGSTFCANDADQTIVNGTPTPGNYSGPGITGNSFSPSVAGSGNHVLTYSVTDANSCSDSATFTVLVNPTPAAPTISQNGADLCVSTVPGATFVWLEGGTAIPGATSNCYTALTNGSYSVTITNPEGCSATSAIYILSDLSLLKKELDFRIKLYPNPTDNLLILESTDENSTFTFTISNVLGQEISIVDEKLSKHLVDVSALQSGIYFLQIEGVSGKQSFSFAIK